MVHTLVETDEYLGRNAASIFKGKDQVLQEKTMEDIREGEEDSSG